MTEMIKHYMNQYFICVEYIFSHSKRLMGGKGQWKMALSFSIQVSRALFI